MVRLIGAAVNEGDQPQGKQEGDHETWLKALSAPKPRLRSCTMARQITT
jgi:hypothetical protein